MICGFCIFCFALCRVDFSFLHLLVCVPTPVITLFFPTCLPVYLNLVLFPARMPCLLCEQVLSRYLFQYSVLDLLVMTRPDSAWTLICQPCGIIVFWTFFGNWIKDTFVMDFLLCMWVLLIRGFTLVRGWRAAIKQPQETMVRGGESSAACETRDGWAFKRVTEMNPEAAGKTERQSCPENRTAAEQVQVKTKKIPLSV